MWRTAAVRDIVRILMGSELYFRLSLNERYQLVKYMLRAFSPVD